MAKYLYSYHDERGFFNADVSNTDGMTVWSVEYPDYFEDEDGEMYANPTIFDDGYMKNADDIAGLEKYLKQMGIIGKGDELVLSDNYDYAEVCEDEDEYKKGGTLKNESIEANTIYLPYVIADMVAVDITDNFKQQQAMAQHLYDSVQREYRDNPVFRKAIGKGSNKGRDMIYAFMRKEAKNYIAKFEDGGETDGDELIVPKIILKQLHGARVLTAMTGAYNYVGSENSLSFRIKNPKVNYIKITLNGMDTYDVEFGKIHGKKYTVISEEKGVYADQLHKAIERATGMFLSFNFTKWEIGGVVADATSNFRFDINSPSFAAGGATEKFIGNLRKLKEQVYMVQLNDGTLLRGSDIKFDHGGQVDLHKQDDFLKYFYPDVAARAKELGLKIRPDYSISDGGTKYLQPQVNIERNGDVLTRIGISYYDVDDNSATIPKDSYIIIDVLKEDMKFYFPEWQIEDPVVFAEGGEATSFKVGQSVTFDTGKVSLFNEKWKTPLGKEQKKEILSYVNKIGKVSNIGFATVEVDYGNKKLTIPKEYLVILPGNFAIDKDTNQLKIKGGIGPGNGKGGDVIFVNPAKPVALKNNFTIELEAVPNPDYMGDDRGRVRVKRYTVKVDTIQEAQEALEAFIDKHGLGGGNLPEVPLYHNGQKIGFLSYNGRVWVTKDKPLHGVVNTSKESDNELRIAVTKGIGREEFTGRIYLEKKNHGGKPYVELDYIEWDNEDAPPDFFSEAIEEYVERNLYSLLGMKKPATTKKKKGPTDILKKYGKKQ